MGSSDQAPLESLPAAYGELVNGAFARQTGWCAPWFQHEATCQVTYDVPSVLPDWKDNPRRVRTCDRSGRWSLVEENP